MQLFWLMIAVLTLLALIIMLWPLMLTKKKPQTRAWLTIIVLVLLVPLLALGLYLKLGSSSYLSQTILAAKKTQQTDAQFRKVSDQIIPRLKQHLEKNPDGRGWFLLGRLYLSNQDFAAAETSLSKAYQLTPTPEIALNYAEARYFNHGQTLDVQAKSLLLEVLKHDSGQADALNLLALDAYRNGNFGQAIRYWQQLLPQYAAESEAYKMLVQQISLTQQQMAR